MTEDFNQPWVTEPRACFTSSQWIHTTGNFKLDQDSHLLALHYSFFQLLTHIFKPWICV